MKWTVPPFFNEKKRNGPFFSYKNYVLLKRIIDADTLALVSIVVDLTVNILDVFVVPSLALHGTL